MSLTDKQRDTELGDETFRRLSRFYLLALTFIALSAIGGQLLVQYYLQHQLGDAKVVNIAGRQRMLSQKLTKEILLVIDNPQVSAHQLALKNTLKQWTIAHEGLQNGNDSLKLIGNNSLIIKQLFEQINPYYLQLQRLSQQILVADTMLQIDKETYLRTPVSYTHLTLPTIYAV